MCSKQAYWSVSSCVGGGGEDALGVQVAGECGSARPVLGVDEVVDAHRVVQEREEEDHDRVGPVERLREPEPVRADRAPVQLAVDMGADSSGAGSHLGEKRFERDWIVHHREILAQTGTTRRSERGLASATADTRRSGSKARFN